MKIRPKDTSFLLAAVILFLTLTTYYAKASLYDIQAVSAMYGTSVVLKNDGRVLTWGGNSSNGGLGDGSGVNYRVYPGAVKYLENIIQINTSSETAFALKPDGTVWGWGLNYAGQLGLGIPGDRSTVPVQFQDVNDPTGYLTNVAAIRPYTQNTHFIKNDRTLWSVGSNGNSWELLRCPTDAWCGNSGSHIPVQANISNVVDVARDGGGVYIVRVDRTVWAAGPYVSGNMLGIGSGYTLNTTQFVPKQVVNSDETGFLTGIVDIEAGVMVKVALKDDGTVWTWGYNSYYGLGHGAQSTTHNSPTPQMVEDASDPTGHFTNAISIAAGNRCVAILKADGTVWNWGFWATGDGTYASRFRPFQVLTNASDPTSYLTDVIAIAAGGEYLLALKEDGSVWAWGDNFWGNIGDGTRNNVRYTAVQVNMPNILFRLDMPSTLSPGAEANAVITYQNIFNEPLVDAIIAVNLPSDFVFVSCTHDCIVRDDVDSFQVFWKLGNVNSLETGQFSLKVEVPWGVPEGKTNVSGTIAARNFDPKNLIDIDDYLNYSPVYIVYEEDLTEQAITDLLAADTELKTLFDFALDQGYEFYDTGKYTEFNDGTAVTTFVFLDFEDFGPVYLHRTGEAVFLDRYQGTVYSRFDQDGGYSIDTNDGTSASWGTWSETHSMALAWCVYNCVSKAVSYAYIKQIISLINSADTISDCTKCFLYRDANTCTKCVSSIIKATPLAGLAVSIGECIGQCLRDPNSHYCTQDKKECGTSDVMGFFLGTSGEGVWTTRCEVSSGRWREPPTFDWCISGQACYNAQCVNIYQIALLAPTGSATNVEIYRPRPVRFTSGHDPNEKSVDYTGDVLPGQILTYTIDYENVGLGTAFGVFILDELDPNLDETTIVVNDGGVYTENLRLLEWQIGTLPPGGKGAVSFSVQVKDPLPHGTEISNAATIYFPSAREVTPTNPVLNVVATIAADAQELATDAATPLPITLSGRDYFSLPLSYTITGSPSYGTLSGTPPDVIYQPENGYVGQDEIFFAVSNGSDVSAPARVAISINPDPADQDPPEVVSTSPADGTVNVHVEAVPVTIAPDTFRPAISAQFSEQLDPATITGATFTVDGLTGFVMYYKKLKKAIFTPLTALENSRTYTARLSNLITDLGGNHMPEYSWQFATESIKNMSYSLPGAAAGVDFGEILLGISSPEKIITLMSTGTEPLTIGEITVTGTNQDDFTNNPVEDKCSTMSLEQFDNCTVRVLFTPSSIGTKSAYLNIPSDDSDSPVTEISLSGLGVSSETVLHDLQVVVEPAGGGTVTSDVGGINCAGCTESYVENTVVMLTASPAAGHIFNYFAGCDSAVEDECVVTMTEPKQITAYFELGGSEPDADGDGIPDAVDICPFDADNDLDDDGVCGDVDGCPLDPGKIEPGICGCFTPDSDSDSDGVPDCQDNCPSDPGKIDPGICGCGVPDTDSDGDSVPDCFDNCPFDPGKTEPGICSCGTEDIDSDGDGILDCLDVCPLDNPDDTDEDGICDSDDSCLLDPDNDIDGDTVCGDADNCPDDPNSNQSDQDGDSLGDICDTCPHDPDNDIDEDAVCGDIDNCPADANPDQLDFDSDGLGDVCDTDMDNDEVGNSLDLCAFTSPGEIIDPSNGCSLTQLVPCDYQWGSGQPWKNHGHFIKTLSKMTNHFVRIGLITGEEKAFIMAEMAASECGKN